MNLMTVENLISRLQCMPQEAKVCLTASFRQPITAFHISLRDCETEVAHDSAVKCVVIRLLGNAQNEH